MDNTNLQASFRGIPFFIETNNQSNGRVLAIHKIPGRDNPYIADLGRKNRPFSINGRVIGDDYIDQLKNLQTASEIAGPGQLVDPDFGNKMVVCEGFSLTTTDSQKRVGRFSFSFIEYSGDDFRVTPAINTRAAVKNAAIQLSENAVNDFVKKFDDPFKPLYIHEKALIKIKKLLILIKKKSFVFNAIDEFNYALNNLVMNANSIISTPQIFADAIRSLFNVPAGGYSLISKIDDLFDLFNNIEININDQFSTFLKSILIGNIATETTESEFETYDDAVYYNDKVKSSIETLEPFVSDEVFEKLYALKTTVMNDLSARFIDYPRISTIVLNEPTPAIIVAYQLYGSIEKADEIILRNKLLHPGFVPDGIPIKVVSDE